MLTSSAPRGEEQRCAAPSLSREGEGAFPFLGIETVAYGASVDERHPWWEAGPDRGAGRRASLSGGYRHLCALLHAPLSSCSPAAPCRPSPQSSSYQPRSRPAAAPPPPAIPPAP